MRWSATLLLALLLAACAGAPPHAVPVVPELAGSDEEMTAMLAPYAVEVERLRTPIGRCAEAMRKTRGDGPLGTWMASCLLDHARAASGTRVDAAFVNGGGVRADMEAGPVSMETMINIQPFENRIVIFELTGAQLLRLGEFFSSKQGFFPMEGMAIEGAADWSLVSMTVAARPVDPAATYRVATSDYLANGGDNLSLLAEFPKPELFEATIRDAMIARVQAAESRGEQVTPPGEPFKYRYAGKTIEDLGL